jgi:rare lipoprotein A (peptidoglycan hydrolase)
MSHHIARAGQQRPPIRMLLLLGTLTTLAACSSSRGNFSDASPPRPMARVQGQASGFSPSSQGGSASIRPGAGRTISSYKIGKPYSIGGVWYVPREDPTYDRTGMGSWYGADFHGRLTANGEIYDMNAMTAAHPTLPLPSYVDVTNVANGKTVRVRVNDRGPYIGGRIIDMSRAAARQLGFETQGKAEVRVRYAGRAPLNGLDGQAMASNTAPSPPIVSLPWSQSKSATQPTYGPASYGLGAANFAAPNSDREPSTEWSTQQHRRALAQQRTSQTRSSLQSN